jgi:hypothetical protein
MIFRAAQLSTLVYPAAVAHGEAECIAHDRDAVAHGARALGMEFLAWHDDAGTDTEFAMICEPGKTWIAVRGTTSLRDVYTDIRATRREFTVADGDKARIHAGGYSCAMSVAGTIATQLRARPWDDVIFTGHSLGGMIAQILAVMMPTRYGVGDRKISTITFGQPRAGCRRFARALRALDGTHVRAYHRGDPVPWLPGALSRLTPWPRYVHAGEPMAWPCSRVGIAAHKMAGYLADAAAIR